VSDHLAISHQKVLPSNVNDIETKRNKVKQSETRLRSWQIFHVEAKQTWLIPEYKKIEATQTLLIQDPKKIEPKRPMHIP
jgi:hypothetical protein